MAMIYVRAKPGRRAYYEGRQIPHDRFIAVADTPQIRRLRDHWQDIEVEPPTEPPVEPPPVPPPA